RRSSDLSTVAGQLGEKTIPGQPEPSYILCSPARNSVSSSARPWGDLPALHGAMSMPSAAYAAIGDTDENCEAATPAGSPRQIGRVTPYWRRMRLTSSATWDGSSTSCICSSANTITGSDASGLNASQHTNVSRWPKSQP